MLRPLAFTLVLSTTVAQVLQLFADHGSGPIGYTHGCTSSMPRPPSPFAPPADLVITANANLQWVVNGVVQPLLTLTRGRTYLLDLTAFGDEHPFLINNQSNNPFGQVYLANTYGSVVSFTPTAAMPANLWYHCSVHYGMTGPITLVNNCVGDLNNDLAVNSTDFGLFVGAFGTSCIGCKADINGNGVVNSTDFGLFVAAFGTTCN